MAMVWEVHEKVSVEDGHHKETRIRCNFGHGESTFGWMRIRVGRSRTNKEEKSIMCGGGSGDWVLRRSKGRGIFPHITEGNAEVLGRYQV